MAKPSVFILVDLSLGRIELDLIACGESHYGVAGLVEINALNVEESVRGGNLLVVLLHTVVN